MPRVALDLNTDEGRGVVNGQWKVAEGYVPGEPNEGLKSQVLDSPARLADYDDSGWRVCENVRESLSVGFTFAWYRMSVTVPDSAGGASTQGARVFFETNIDNYGEVWVNGEIDRTTGVVVGINAPQRVEVSGSATSGDKHVIACLVGNGPLAEPRGGIWMRYATLAFESPG
jgi:hypothetical protein